MGIARIDSRQLHARFARAHRALRTAAVTGTNGKTTTTSMLASIVAASGETVAYLTTLGAWVDGARIEQDTPTHEFLATVERAVDRGVATLALEVTSKALAGGLARRWPPHVAAFTNLSRDHLDMHNSPEAYLAAKAQLFMALPGDGVAVLNADDPASALIEQVMSSGARVRRYSVRPDTAENAELVARAVMPSPTGTRVELVESPLASALGGVIELAVVGAVHAQNALAAALAADSLGYPGDVIRRGLDAFTGVAGRFQIVGKAPLVVVDYAHTPDGLRGTLHTARDLVGGGGRLICVFGCGGERDQGKRPEMGAIADHLADVAVLTNDNPRGEDPDAIARHVRDGARAPRAQWKQEFDRRAAIEWAIAQASPADVVVIAGKGHEDAQEIGDERIPFSDAEVAAAACTRR